MVYWLLKHVIFGPLIRLVARPAVSGLTQVPRSGPVIIAANHLAQIDSLLLAVVLPRPLRFIAKSEYFSADRRGARCYAWLCRVTGQIPVERSGGGAADGALEAVRELLAEGGTWGIYPEGTRSPDGRLYRGHTGAMRVALSQPGLTLLPVGIAGTREIDDRSRRGWRRGRARVVIGEAFDLSGYADDPAGWRAATDALMARIAELSGQEYVEEYAGRLG